jgi:hypothetical protein
VYGYYPSVVEIGPEVIIATDGLGQLSVLRNGQVVGSLQEDIPFIIFDAKTMDNRVYILICQTLQSPSEVSTSKPLKGDYLLRKLRLEFSTILEYQVISSLSGTEIPKHAVLTPDILIVTQSPFRQASLPPDTDAMSIDEASPPLPLYTYFQTETDIDISIPLPLATLKSAINIQFSTSTLQLHFLPPTSPSELDLSETFPFQTPNEKPLWGAIDPMTSTWTLSTTPTGKVIDIHLEKIDQGNTRWPQLFEDPDEAEEYTDPSDRRTILERLEKYTSNNVDPSADVVRRRFMLEEDEDIDVDIGGFIQLFHNANLEVKSVEVLATPFQGETLGVKVSLDMCVFEIGGHVVTFPAFSFVASSKRLRKYVKFTERFALIVESGRGGNMYVYYIPEDGLVAKQVVVRLGVESLGIGLVEEGVVLIGEGDGGFEAVVVGGL